MTDASEGFVRIGELGRRTGVSPELLRAWEKRYALLRPSRSAGGFRLYSVADERRVRSMTALIASGLSASEAASKAVRDDVGAPSGPAPLVGSLAERLRMTLDDFDDEGAHAVFDGLLAAVSVETALVDVLIPFLHELGERWERDEVSVAQEHFASNLIRGRLLGIARDWARGSGPAYVLACPPGEEHDLALIMFGIALAHRGARVVFLGADTPVETLRDAVRSTRPAAVVLAAARPEPLREVVPALRTLAANVPVWLCGRGARERDADAIGARVLKGDPVSAARDIA